MIKYSDPDELQRKIDDYFAICDAGRLVTVIDKRGTQQQYNQPIPYTMEGLAAHLDVDSRTIRRYRHRDNGTTDKLVSDIIARARRKIQDNWIVMGMMGVWHPKIVALCLSASEDDYKANQDNTLTVLTIEDRLRQIHQARQRALPDPDTIDAEVIE